MRLLSLSLPLFLLNYFVTALTKCPPGWIATENGCNSPDFNDMQTVFKIPATTGCGFVDGNYNGQAETIAICTRSTAPNGDGNYNWAYQQDTGVFSCTQNTNECTLLGVIGYGNYSSSVPVSRNQRVVIDSDTLYIFMAIQQNNGVTVDASYSADELTLKSLVNLPFPKNLIQETVVLFADLPPNQSVVDRQKTISAIFRQSRVVNNVNGFTGTTLNLIAGFNWLPFYKNIVQCPPNLINISPIYDSQTGGLAQIAGPDGQIMSGAVGRYRPSPTRVMGIETLVFLFWPSNVAIKYAKPQLGLQLNTLPTTDTSKLNLPGNLEDPDARTVNGSLVLIGHALNFCGKNAQNVCVFVTSIPLELSAGLVSRDPAALHDFTPLQKFAFNQYLRAQRPLLSYNENGELCGINLAVLPDGHYGTLPNGEVDWIGEKSSNTQFRLCAS